MIHNMRDFKGRFLQRKDLRNDFFLLILLLCFILKFYCFTRPKLLFMTIFDTEVTYLITISNVKGEVYMEN